MQEGEGGSDAAVIKGTRGTAGSEKRQMKGKEGRGEKAAGSKNGKWNIKRLWGGGGLTFIQQGASIRNKCCVCV